MDQLLDQHSEITIMRDKLIGYDKFCPFNDDESEPSDISQFLPTLWISLFMYITLTIALTAIALNAKKAQPVDIVNQGSISHKTG